MYRKVTVSIQETDLAQFDEWCRESNLPRGAAMGSLVRLVRALSKGPVNIQPSTDPVTIDGNEPRWMERVVELDD